MASFLHHPADHVYCLPGGSGVSFVAYLPDLEHFLFGHERLASVAPCTFLVAQCGGTVLSTLGFTNPLYAEAYARRLCHARRDRWSNLESFFRCRDRA